MKFKVSVEAASPRHCVEADESFAVVVANRNGREWCSKSLEGCPGNAAERAMVLEEFLNDGGKLDPEKWDEVA